MDIRFLLVFILPALVTAGTYSDETVPLDMGNEDKEFDNLGSYKDENEYKDISGSLGAEILNEGNSAASAAAQEYGAKAKTVEQSATWFRNLYIEKQRILTELKKRLNLLRAMATENLQSAEQYRQSAAEKSQSAKALETKAREAQSLSKDYAVQVNELRSKMNNELKQYLQSQISYRIAESNANADLTEAEMQRTWGMFLEKQAEEFKSEAATWEKKSAETLDMAKKLKLQASTENSKAKELEKKHKEALDAANEAEKKVYDMSSFHLDFNLKSQADALHVALANIKVKYHQVLAASLSESATQVHMFANMQIKDHKLWEMKTASAKAEAKLLEASANKMLQDIEKLKSSLKVSSKLAQKNSEFVPREEKVVKDEPRAIVLDKKV